MRKEHVSIAPLEVVLKNLEEETIRRHESYLEIARQLNPGLSPPLSSIIMGDCSLENTFAGFKLQKQFPEVLTTVVGDPTAQGNMYGARGHVVGIGLYQGEFFAFDASIAQMGGEHTQKDIGIWRGKSIGDLRERLVATFGGSWTRLDTTVQLLQHLSSLPVADYRRAAPAHFGFWKSSPRTSTH